jgi:hypothetical protein
LSIKTPRSRDTQAEAAADSTILITPDPLAISMKTVRSPTSEPTLDEPVTKRTQATAFPLSTKAYDEKPPENRLSDVAGVSGSRNEPGALQV